MLRNDAKVFIGVLTVVNPRNCLGFLHCIQGILKANSCHEHRGSVAVLYAAHLEGGGLYGWDGRLLLHIEEIHA